MLSARSIPPTSNPPRGLAHRTSGKYHPDPAPHADGDTDGSDLTYWFTYDDRWRVVATFRGSDTDPKEVFVHHAAGLNGQGGSSYIDSLLLRDRDETTAWTASADSTPETRSYYVQNWRNDVVAMTTASGRITEWARYSAYGEARVRSRILGDYDGDGDIDSDDTNAFLSDWNNSTGNADVDEDGDHDSDDITLFAAAWDNAYEGWQTGLSLEATSGNRLGYAGYHYDPATSQYHVRHRVYVPEFGRWTKRDPLGYVDGMGLYGYVELAPLKFVDSSGFRSSAPGRGEGSAAGQLIPQPPKRVPRHPDPRVIFPPAPGLIGPIDDATRQCQTACEISPPGVIGVTICWNNFPFACVCPSALTATGSDIFNQALAASCVPRHELIHVKDIDCTLVGPGLFTPRYPPGGPGLPWRPTTTGACSECEAYRDSLACVTGIDCQGSVSCEKARAQMLMAINKQINSLCPLCR